MSKDVLPTVERWIAVITSIIGIAGTINGVYVFLVRNYPAKWVDYLALLATVGAIAVAVYFFRKPKEQIKYEFLPNADDVEQQAKLVSVTRQARFQGLRFSEALQNENFVTALKHPKEIRLLIMSKFPTPVNDLEKEHNRKYDENRDRLLALRADNVRITVKELPGCPEYNISIFDSTLARRRKYDQNIMSAKNSQAQVFHWETSPKQIREIIQSYDSMWEKASYVDLD